MIAQKHLMKVNAPQIIRDAVDDVRSKPVAIGLQIIFISLCKIAQRAIEIDDDIICNELVDLNILEEKDVSASEGKN